MTTPNFDRLLDYALGDADPETIEAAQEALRANPELARSVEEDAAFFKALRAVETQEIDDAWNVDDAELERRANDALDRALREENAEKPRPRAALTAPGLAAMKTNAASRVSSLITVVLVVALAAIAAIGVYQTGKCIWSAGDCATSVTASPEYDHYQSDDGGSNR